MGPCKPLENNVWLLRWGAVGQNKRVQLVASLADGVNLGIQ